jgi:hypothetical protein
MKNKFILTLILFINFFVFSQNEKKSLNTNSNDNSSIGYLLINDLEKNGINSKLLNENLDLEVVKKIRYFDFNKYRDFSKVQLVQISNGGPIIELYSIEYLLKKGFVFDNSFLDSKKGRDFSGVIHQTIPIVNIGNQLKQSELLK